MNTAYLYDRQALLLIKVWAKAHVLPEPYDVFCRLPRVVRRALVVSTLVRIRADAAGHPSGSSSGRFTHLKKGVCSIVFTGIREKHFEFGRE